MLSGNFTNRGVLEVSDQLLIKAEGRIDNFGAAIQAGALGLFGVSLDNRNGRIEAASLALSVDGELNNTRGQILIDKDAAIHAGGDLINDSGRIEAGSLAVSVAGDLFNRTLYAVDRNETTTRSHTEYDSVFGATTTTDSDTTVVQHADQRAGIVARSDDLDLNVGKNLTSTGADLTTSGDLTGRVGGKIDIQALSIENSRTQTHSVTNERTYTYNNGETEITGLTASGSQVSTQIDRQIQHQGARLEAGGKLDLESGGSTFILGADLKSGGETRLVAGGHLVIGAVQNSTHTESRVVTQTDGAVFLPGLVTRNGEQLKLTHSESAVGGGLESGGGTTLQAGGSLVLSGQNIQSKGDTRLVGDSVVLEGLSLNHSTISQDTVRNTIDLQTSNDFVATRIHSGGRLDIVSTGTLPEARPSKDTEPKPNEPPPPPAPGSLSGRGVILEAQGSLTLAATGDVTLTAGYDSQQFAQRNKSGSSVVERSRNDAVGSTLSGSEVTVSGRNLSLEAVKVNAIDATGAKGDVNIIAQENLSLTAATDQSYEHTVSVKKGGGLLRKKVTTTEHTEQTADAVVSDLTGQDIKLKSGGNIDLYGTRINAQGETVLDAGGVLSAYALQNVNMVQDRREVTKSLLGLSGLGLLVGFTVPSEGDKEEATDTLHTQQSLVAHLQSQDSLTLQSGGDTLLQGTQIQASETHISVGQGDKASAEAKLIIEGAKNRTETSHTASKKSDAWQGMSGHGETTETLTLVNIKGPVTIQAPKIVVQLPEGEFKTQFEKLSSQPGQEWLLQLADRPDVDWQQVALAHEKWDYQHSGLTAEAALVIAIVVAIVMPAGAGASLTGTSGALGAAANAGLTALAAQATISAINNKGDLGKILSDLGSEESIRSLATTMVTAGALNALAGQISFTNADGTLTKLSEISAKSDFVAQLGKNAINNTLSALIDTSINGGDLGDKIGRGLFLGAVDAAGASAANWVGDLDGFSNKVGHLIVGCAMGAAKSGDCASGAVGGLVGELVAEWYGGSRAPVNATEASELVQIARLFGALTNTVIGGDAQVGADAAGNAAQNNWLNHAEARQLSQAKERLQSCQTAQCRSEAQTEIKDLEARDKARNEALATACAAPTSAACSELRRQVTAAAASYVGQSDGLDPFGVIGRERSESQSLATQYDLRSRNAGSYNTVTGAVQSVVGGVVGTVELGLVLSKAAAGDPAAQSQLSDLVKGAGAFIASPLDSTSAAISGTLERADALEAQGRTDEATQLRAKLVTDGVLVITGTGTVVRGGSAVLRGKVVTDGGRSVVVTSGQGIDFSIDGHRIYDPAYPAIGTKPDTTYRFSDPTYRNTSGDVYFGDNVATAYFEVRQNVVGKSLFVGQVEVKNVLDLTDPVVTKRMNIDPLKIAEIASDVDPAAKRSVYSYTNQIANQAYDAGYTGIVYSSTRNPGGKAVVLFNGRYDPMSIQPVLDYSINVKGVKP
ncbi:DUF637 domain-containing protein [Zoogloea sp.]|uniref:DUF637 domain-containing protein n=1 Tax=Zoogloea sp. TaxID=49181 RepID=UPI0031FD6096